MTEAENTKVYFMDVRALADEEHFNSMLAKVSETRRRKVMAYRFMKDRCLSLGAELLLRDALADYDPAASGTISDASAPDIVACAAVGSIGASKVPVRLEFEYGANEKPYLKARDDIFFNLSHSGNYVMCAVSNSEIGCDIQETGEADLNLAKRFFTEREYHIIADQPTEEARRDMFYRYWTLKESFMKATGLGMKLPLDSFEILIDPGTYDTAAARTDAPADPCATDIITLTQSVDERTYTFREFNDIPGYKASICTAIR